jgi:hypothetical protein
MDEVWARKATRPKPLNLIAACAKLSCSPSLVSIELEDANADPDHPGGCGARAFRLRRN